MTAANNTLMPDEMPERITAWKNYGKFWRETGDFTHPMHFTARAGYVREDLSPPCAEVVEMIKVLSANVQVLCNVIRDPDGGSEIAKRMILLTADNTVSDARALLEKNRVGG